MKPRPLAILFTLVVALVGASVLPGCSSSPKPRMYLFSPSDAWRANGARDLSSSSYLVRFASVRIPAYLDRPQMVTRISDDEIHVDEFNRWGMPMESIVKGTLSESISTQLPEAYVEIAPIRPQQEQGYQVQVDIVRLDGYPGGTVELIAQWKVVRIEQEGVVVLAQRLGRYEAKAVGTSTAAYVSALRQTLSALGDDLAGVIRDSRN